MKRFCAPCAFAVAAAFAIGGCNDFGNTFQSNTGAQLQSLAPSNIPAGGADFTLTVNGSGFVKQTVVVWNQQKLNTTVTTNSNGAVTQVTAVVPANLTAHAGTAPVFTQNPFSGSGNNGLSNTIIFIVNNPPNKIPSITGVTSGAATSGGLPITITGTDFLNSSTDATQVSTANFVFGSQQSNITPAVSAITTTQIQTTIPNALLASPGCAHITVFNPASPPVPNIPGSVGSGGGTSNQWPFPVGNGVCPAAAKASSSASSAASPGISEETPSLSVDGRYVAYSAVEKDHSQVFVRDTCVGAPSGCQPRTQLISVAVDGSARADDDSRSPSMSADGRYIAFSSAATNLVSDVSASPGRQVYLRDTCLGVASSCQPSTRLVSIDPEGALGGAEAILPSVSASGRFIAFLAVTPSPAGRHSAKNDSASAVNSGFRQVFVRDTCLNTPNCTPKTTRISLVPGDGSGGKLGGPAISGDSRQVASPSAAAAILFTHSVAVDDQVFLAATKQP